MNLIAMLKIMPSLLLPGLPAMANWAASPAVTMSSVAEAYQRAIIKTPFVVGASYWESASKDGTYCMFTQGKGYLLSAGYDCPIPVDNFSLLLSGTRKSNRTAAWTASMKPYFRNNGDIAEQSDMPPGYNALLSGVRFFEQWGPLNPSVAQNYQLERRDTVVKGGASFLKVQFRPATGAKASYAGYLLVDKKDGGLRKIALEAFPYYFNNSQKYLLGQLLLELRWVGGKCYFSSIQCTVKDNSMKYEVGLLTIGNYKPLAPMEKKEYNRYFHNDVNPMVHYDPGQWKGSQAVPGISMQKLRQDLEKEMPLERQFALNSRKPFFDGRRKTGETLGVDGGTSTYQFIEEKIKAYDKLFQSK